MLCFVIGGDNIAAVVLMVHPTVNNVDGGGAKGVMESFAGNGTSHPTNMQIETVSLYCIFVVSFLYLWLTIYAIRQVFGIVCTKEKESLSSKSVRQR